MIVSWTSRRAAAASTRIGLALGAAVALALLGTGVAAAHVTAQPGTAAKGGYATVAFRVPSEMASAGTVKVQVTLPAEHPIVSVRTAPMAGWAAEVAKEPLAVPVEAPGSKITEAVRTITWAAQPGTRLGPTEFADFTVSMGRLPDDVNELVMPTVQTYDDGTVVRWDQPEVPGAEEPEHPAPTLKLVEADHGADGDAHGGDAHGGAGPAAEVGGHHHGDTSEAAGTGSDGTTDDTARWLGGAGLLVGALGLGVGIAAVARTRRSRP